MEWRYVNVVASTVDNAVGAAAVVGAGAAVAGAAVTVGAGAAAVPGAAVAAGDGGGELHMVLSNFPLTSLKVI